MPPTRSPFLAFAVLAAVVGAGAVSISVTRRDAGGAFTVHGQGVKSFASAASGIMDDQDLLYTAQITVGSRAFGVQLDTGSSDLWVFPGMGVDATQFGAQDYQLPVLQGLNITYGLGSVAGTAAAAQVQFGSYSVPQQAFLDVKIPDMDALFALNAYGILGLSFPSASVLFGAFQSTNQPQLGLPFLQNIFLSQPGQPNMLAFYLGRTGDAESTAPGTFSIGEVDPQYAAVEQTPVLPVFINPNPQSLQRWTVSVDAVVIAGTTYTVASDVQGAPSGKQLALLDTGTSRALMPPGAVQALYSSIPGATYDQDVDMWFVPCTGSTTFSFIFGGQEFPVHPLDVTVVTSAQLNNGTTVTVCTNAYEANTDLSEFDFLLGDSFLRNAFQAYNFGDTDQNGNPASSPYVKMLALTDGAAAQADFLSGRMQALATLPPEADLNNAALMADVKGTATNAAAKANTPHHAKIHGHHRPSGSSGRPIVAIAQNDASSSGSDVSGQLNKLLNIGPFLLGLLAANVTLGLALCALGVYIIRQNRRRKARTGDVPLQAYQPVRNADDALPAGGYRDHSPTPEPKPKHVPMNGEDGPGGYRDSGVFLAPDATQGTQRLSTTADPLIPPSAPALRASMMGASPRSSMHDGIAGMDTRGPMYFEARTNFAPPIAPSPFADDVAQHRLSATLVPLPRSAAPSPVPSSEQQALRSLQH